MQVKKFVIYSVESFACNQLDEKSFEPCGPRCDMVVRLYRCDVNLRRSAPRSKENSWNDYIS